MLHEYSAAAGAARSARIAHLCIWFAAPNVSLHLHSHWVSLRVRQCRIHRPRRLAAVQELPIHIDWLPRRERLRANLLHRFVPLEDRPRYAARSGEVTLLNRQARQVSRGNGATSATRARRPAGHGPARTLLPTVSRKFPSATSRFHCDASRKNLALLPSVPSTLANVSTSSS